MRIISSGRRTLTADDLSRIHLPEDFWRVKVQDVQASVREPIENYLVKFEEMAAKAAGLLLWGPTGVGKTSIGALVAKEARARGYTAYFTTVFDLRESLRSKMMFDESSSVLDRCRDVDVLILDNFQAADVTEPFVNLRFVEELLVSRGSHLKVSVMTTRMSRQELKGLGTFISAVEGHMVSINVAGEDLRKQRGDDLKNAVLGTKKV